MSRIIPVLSILFDAAAALGVLAGVAALAMVLS